ncbi:BhlA/UviB family holin-like peptide [Candidatus Contubernalis alkaliaceticus]|uniref:BhlA/UviB family holin-like peptide n=1 Tax=Candidatus Contubernalis alkaliaceticus TaxID=338645 RepID=UPI001F4C351E|nr:BhlA/UviB family holin-like peptide [Candidatus Contubernalis alkalaceticus]
MGGTESKIVDLAISQGIWAVLFVALFFYVLKTGGERERRLIEIIDCLRKDLSIVNDIKKGVSRIEKKIGSWSDGNG